MTTARYFSVTIRPPFPTRWGSIICRLQRPFPPVSLISIDYIHYLYPLQRFDITGRQNSYHMKLLSYHSQRSNSANASFHLLIIRVTAQPIDCIRQQMEIRTIPHPVPQFTLGTLFLEHHQRLFIEIGVVVCNMVFKSTECVSGYHEQPLHNNDCPRLLLSCPFPLSRTTDPK